MYEHQLKHKGERYLFANKRLFYSCQIFQRGQQNMSGFWPSNVFDKVAKLFTQCCQDLVFIFDGLWRMVSASDQGCANCVVPTIQERYQLVPRALCPKGEGNSGQAMYGIQSQEYVVMLYRVS